MRKAVDAELHQRFRPEFLNRIDDVIVFHSLDLAEIRQIIGIQLRKLGKLIEERGLSLEISDAAKDLIAQEGYDPAFGARPLKRALQRMIIDPLAIRLLEGQFKPGDTVFVNAAGGGKVELSLEPEPASVN